MTFFSVAFIALYGLFFAVCAALIIYLIIKRVNKKDDFEKRDN